MTDEDAVYCETCDERITPDEAVRTETMGNLDPTKWQSLCCPSCGRKLRTVYVGDE